MNKSKLIIILFIFLANASLNAQESFVKFKGQVDGYTGSKFGSPVQWQTGARFIPSVSIGKQWKNNLKFDSEFSFNSYLDYHFTGWNKDGKWTGITPYRLWLRLSTDRFELRAGLQKINFGSASMLRPLMWFDRMDPRDPLQITSGVYGLLGRYYFQKNANLWLWILWKNNKTKGWETIPSLSKIPESGGRIQLPVPKGEAAISYHHRTADLRGLINPVNIHGATSYPEDRLGLDGKWDLGIGLWTEYSLIRSKLDTSYFEPWTKLFTIGIDYTFSIGNGLYMACELFRYSNAAKVFDSGIYKTISSLNVNYSFGISKLGTILYFDLSEKSWYRFINLQRQSDNWTFYLFLFWNPDKIAIYNLAAENNMFAGKGIQFMTVYNF
jgi:hypothetical protein